MTNKMLGIIAGSGELPIRVAQAHTLRSGEVCIAKLWTAKLDYSAYNYAEFKCGEVGRLFEYFHKYGVRDIIMVGGIKRPNLLSLKVDAQGALLLALITKAKFVGDDKLLRIITQFFEENGFQILSALTVLSSDMTAKAGIIVKKVAHDIMHRDISIGLKAAKALGAKDLGQSVIVRDGEVIGEEDASGTDALIHRCKGSGGILVKAVKPIQDMRLDIPVIGCNTVHNAAAAGLEGIAIEANSVIVIDRDAVIKLANELEIFIIAV